MASIESRAYSDKLTGKLYTRYKAKIRLKGFPYEESTFDRKSDAEQWAAKREYELKYQQKFGPQAYKTKTVADLLSRYADALVGSNPRRFNEIKPMLDLWAKVIGMYKIADLSKDIVARERDRLKKRHVKDDPARPTLSNAAVNRTVSVLKRALNVAANDWGWLTVSPLDGLKSLPEPKGRTRFLQGTELDRLLDATKQSDNEDLMALTVLGITTGARRSELRKIRLKDVNLLSKQVLLPTSKNGKPRVLFVEGYAFDLLTGLVARAKPKQLYLFPSPHDATKPNDFRTAWRTAIRRAEIMDFKFHDLRHTAASFLAMNGAGLHQIAEILGHTSLQVTKRYTHLLESHTAKVVETTAAKVFNHDNSGLDKQS